MTRPRRPPTSNTKALAYKTPRVKQVPTSQSRRFAFSTAADAATAFSIDCSTIPDENNPKPTKAMACDTCRAIETLKRFSPDLCSLITTYPASVQPTDTVSTSFFLRFCSRPNAANFQCQWCRSMAVEDQSSPLLERFACL